MLEEIYNRLSLISISKEHSPLPKSNYSNSYLSELLLN